MSAQNEVIMGMVEGAPKNVRAAKKAWDIQAVAVCPAGGSGAFTAGSAFVVDGAFTCIRCASAKPVASGCFEFRQ